MSKCFETAEVRIAVLSPPTAPGSSLEAAKTEAIKGARDVIANLIQGGQPVCSSYRIEITDETGSLRHTVQFGEVIDLRP